MTTTVVALLYKVVWRPKRVCLRARRGPFGWRGGVLACCRPRRARPPIPVPVAATGGGGGVSVLHNTRSGMCCATSKAANLLAKKVKRPCGTLTNSTSLDSWSLCQHRGTEGGSRLGHASARVTIIISLLLAAAHWLWPWPRFLAAAAGCGKCLQALSRSLAPAPSHSPSPSPQPPICANGPFQGRFFMNVSSEMTCPGCGR